MKSITAETLRKRFRFGVERIRQAAGRLAEIDRMLASTREALEEKAGRLSSEATNPQRGPLSVLELKRAQAHRAASLATRASIRELLKPGLALVSAMAVSRWLWALRSLRAGSRGEAGIRTHVEAGRIAYRVFASLRRKSKMVTGIGQLVSALVVAEFAHDKDRNLINDQIEEGFHSGRIARGIRSDEDVLEAVSTALRESATLLERLARRAEPLAEELRLEAEDLEARVEQRLSGF